MASLAWNGHRLRLSSLGRENQPWEVLAWIARHARTGPAMVAIDAPTIVRNPTGRREAEALLTRDFARYHAGVYPSNLGRPFAARTTGFARALARRGFLHADRIATRTPGRYQIEVYPHSAAIRLFDLPGIGSVGAEDGRVSGSVNC